MLSYQHAFHAGNRADLIKHAVLHTALEAMAHEKSPWFYVETHAGRGHYDLASKQAQKTGEHQDGISALHGENVAVPAPLSSFVSFIQNYRDEFGASAYPGSPQFARRMLSDSDRIALFERHPQEHSALLNTVGEDSRVRVQKSDGYLGALSLQPRRKERLALLVDPSYETGDDILNVGNWVPRALSKWPNAVLMVWLPLFLDARETELLEHLASFEPTAIVGTRWPTRPQETKALSGSAMALFGVSEHVSDRAEAITDALHDLWWASENE